VCVCTICTRAKALRSVTRGGKLNDEEAVVAVEEDVRSIKLGLVLTRDGDDIEDESESGEEFFMMCG